MVKLYKHSPASPVHDTATAFHIANSVAMVPAAPHLTPRLPALQGLQSSRNAIPHTGGHPFLLKFQRSQENMSVLRQVKLLDVIASLCEKGRDALSIRDLDGMVPGCTMVKDELRDGSGYFDIHTSPRFCLSDSYVVSEVEARVDVSDEAVKMVTLSLENAYIQPATLEKQIGKLNLQLPRVDSPSKTVFYISSHQWGEMRFGYHQEQPGMLTSIVFDKNPT